MVVGTIGILVCAIGFGLRANPVSAKVGESALLRGEHFVHWAGDFKCIEGDTLVRWPGNYQGVAIVPPEVRKIGAHAFISCKGVTGVKFMGPVKVIGREAFLFCDGLGEMAIPPTVTNIGDSAFGACRSLTNLVIGSGMAKVPNGMCKDCRQLKRVEFSDGLQEIGDDAFVACRSLKRLVLPFGVERIGDRAFLGCGSLREVAFPKTVRKIGKNAFSGCCDLAVAPTNFPLVAEAMKECGVALRSDSVQDLNGLKAAVKIAANGFARCDFGGEVMLAAMDAFAACRPALGVGADMVDVERCITMSGASKTVFCGTGGIDEIDIVFGTYEGGLVEVRMKMVDLKVSDIEFSETMKKGVRLGLESSGETPEEKVRKWL